MTSDSFKHALASEKLVLRDEKNVELDQLRADLRAEHQPINTTEEMLVNEMAEQYWRLRRARRLERELLEADRVVIGHLAAMQRMMSSAERGFYKALTALRELQKARGFVPANSERATQSPELTEPQQNRDCQGAATHGFVPQNLPHQQSRAA